MTPSRHLRLASHLALAAMLLSPAAIMAQEAPPAEQPPGLEAKPVTETYYGQEVTDRFRYVEDLSPEVIDWMKAQGGYTRALFDSIAPRAKIARSVAIWRSTIRSPSAAKITSCSPTMSPPRMVWKPMLSRARGPVWP